jgi:5-formyltetrahydrofolate cyclo-ligase
MTNPRIARDTAQQEPEERPAIRLKKALRADLLLRRKSMDPKGKAISDELIGRRLLEWCEAHAVGSLGVYHPIRNEPDLLVAYNALSARGVHLSLPVVVGTDAALEFRRWRPGDALVKDALGVMVPPADAPMVQPQALLVPCVGYSASGLRLGYGGGFYDRTLSGSIRPLAVGVCYAFGLSEFDGEAHDVPLDLVLSDEA